MKIILKDINQITGRPVTTQRSLLLNLISEAGRHLNADELYQRAKKRTPRISLATVYRNLKLFKELGLIAESNLGDNHSYYEMKGPLEHHHLVCLGCGQVIDFESQLITKAATEIEREKKFNVISVQLKIEGYCPKCKHKKD